MCKTPMENVGLCEQPTCLCSCGARRSPRHRAASPMFLPHYSYPEQKTGLESKSYKPFDEVSLEWKNRNIDFGAEH